LETWNIPAWKSSFVPGGILLCATVLFLKANWLPLALPFLTFLYYAGLLAGLLLAWRFHSSRVFFALLVLFLAQQGIQLFRPLVKSGNLGDAALEVAAILVPLNFVLLSLARERGFTRASVGSTLIFLFVQATAVAALARSSQDYPPLPRASHTAADSLPSTSYVWLAFSIAAAMLLARYIFVRKPVEGGLFWALVSFSFALSSGGHGPAATAYFATSTFIFAVSIIETSYLLAYQDELTGLPSRRAFKDTLLRLQAPYSIAMLDVDHFKRFNDTYGHDTGDQVLRLVASSLAQVTGGGRSYRCGGEEFAIVFFGKGPEEVVGHLERLRATIESSSFQIRGADRRRLPRGPERRNQRQRPRAGRAIRQLAQAESCTALSVTVSIGVAASMKETDPDLVVQAADKALYRAKVAGRNRIETASLPRRRNSTTAAGIA
jgi:diguanylate cyclase (GGDEF)-like protein